MSAATKPNLFLFFGPDNFSAQAKLKRWTVEFEKKYGDLNLSIFDGEDFTANNYREAVGTVPFLSDKKLVIIRDFLAEGTTSELQKVAEEIEELPDYCLLVLIERKEPDKRTSLFKKLKTIGQIIEFAEFQGAQLSDWIKAEAAKKELNLNPTQINTIATEVGPNLWQLSQEIEKLAMYSKTKTLDQQAIENIISPNTETTIFKLTDYISAKDQKRTIQTLNTLLGMDEDLMQITAMVSRHFRILIEVIDCLNQKLSPKQIIEKTKLHPFVINNAIKQSKNFVLADCKKILQALLQIDIDLKSGKIRTTVTDNTELRLALEKLLIKLCTGMNKFPALT